MTSAAELGRQVDGLCFAGEGRIGVAQSRLEGNYWTGAVALLDAESLETVAAFDMPVGVPSICGLGASRLALGRDDGGVSLVRIASSGAMRVDRLLTRHDDCCAVVAGAPDGSAVLSGSWDCSLATWDVESGEVTRLFGDADDEGHVAPVLAAAWAPDGSGRVASGGRDCTVRLWDTTSAAADVVLATLEHPVTSLAWAGPALVAGLEDGSVVSVDARGGGGAGSPVAVHNLVVHAVAPVAEGTVVTCGHDARACRVALSSEGGEVEAVFDAHSDYVTAALVAADGASAVTGSWDGTVRRWVW